MEKRLAPAYECPPILRWFSVEPPSWLPILSLSLVDFHDAMELILDPANAKDPRQVIAICPQVSEKLRAARRMRYRRKLASSRAAL